MKPETLILNGDDVRELLPVEVCIAAVEEAFRVYAAGDQPPPAVLGIGAAGGGFHIKAAMLELGARYFAVKLNGNFPANPSRSGLPTIQGVVALCDAADGRVLALLDSIELTRLRTGAATAIAAKYLARPDSAVLTLFGCGRQSRAQLACLLRVLPIRRLHLYDSNPSASAALARWAESQQLAAEVATAATVVERARQSDVIVTCTPARRPFLTRSHVPPGCFVAAVGADDADKQELEPELLAEHLVVADVLEQCARIGDLHHALEAGLLRREQVHAELADLVAGRRPGRSSAEQITIFDSTGTALSDVAAAAAAFEGAQRQGRGLAVTLAGTADSEVL